MVSLLFNESVLLNETCEKCNVKHIDLPMLFMKD